MQNSSGSKSKTLKLVNNCTNQIKKKRKGNAIVLEIDLVSHMRLGRGTVRGMLYPVTCSHYADQNFFCFIEFVFLS